eukprot:CAMPEP_0202699274 /NCGR_PEP_ID=MMETSP1385-20130828/12481_1 /ASSEMBLY_ACC=CAM_ASM_000861 /TAXON_ID=933848 /ORGANISM="Elphidium margaritaceum" /LENGTH=557 /DNA_ID=CAMNT_0049356171 /DNA_START=26 /DNA_END=1699 /DNA_ORIENTATION=-
MGNFCIKKAADDTLEQIEHLDPENWTQSEVQQWLRLSRDGDLSDLAPIFKTNKISGLTFVRLTNDDLKTIGVKQLGLRDAFICARDQVLNHYQRRLQTITTSVSDIELTTKAANGTLWSASISSIDSQYRTQHVGSSKMASISPSPNHSSSLPQYHQQFETAASHARIPPLSDLPRYADYTNSELAHLLVDGVCRQHVHSSFKTTVATCICSFYFDYERHIEEFAYELWKTLVSIEITTIPRTPNADTPSVRGFTGLRLVQHIEQYSPHYVRHYHTSEIEKLCASLITFSFIRLAAVTDDDRQLVQRLHESDKDDLTKNRFVSHRNYLYQFENARHHQFVRHDEPDRSAWTQSTVVQIYSSTLGKWTKGTVIGVDGDQVTVQYGDATDGDGDDDDEDYDALVTSHAQLMRKTVDRYQDNVVKSTLKFIEERKQWSTQSQIEVFSNRFQRWYNGRVTGVDGVDALHVMYTTHEVRQFEKCLSRWSCDLRQINSANKSLAIASGFTEGTQVMVWSNSKKMWNAGVVKQLFAARQVVNVRYDAFEKLLPLNSPDLRLRDT